ncbi:hypothetical protein B296_00005359 [Ensete ventricosum]|uniref:Uncharacterized protein n=1 Tax=Ensete ventricosum TaxID=4639 RepID=A0A427B9S0_ENSVE|nr:hypothetical protein B296_00005359 [Ensete ventricosum]
MGDGYVGTAQDAVRIRRLEKQREVERRKLEERKKNASAGGQSGLLQFGSGTSEIRDIQRSLGFIVLASINKKKEKKKREKKKEKKKREKKKRKIPRALHFTGSPARFVARGSPVRFVAHGRRIIDGRFLLPAQGEGSR